MMSSSMKLSVLTLVMLAVIVQGDYRHLTEGDNNLLQMRSSKTFTLPFFPFIVITVNPVPCNTANKDMGTCYSNAECTAKGGKKDGICASGFGVCCKFEYECGAIVKTNVSYLVNDGYPSSFKGNGNCQYTVNKINENICQLRLDFEKFKLAQPDEKSLCSVDTFTALADGSNSGEICGDNDGQHIYLDVSGTSVTTRINIATSSADEDGSTNEEREWRIKVTQIDCSSKLRAPDGCLQYFDSYSGDIMSFNYAESSSGLRQLGNMNYAVCVRAKEGLCGIKYEAKPYTEFSLTGDSSSVSSDSEDMATAAGVVGPNCNEDYILIPASRKPDGTAEENDRFCGTKLSADNIFTTYAKPFIVRVLTDNKEVTAPDLGSGSGPAPAPDIENKGFSLRFSQVPC